MMKKRIAAFLTVIAISFLCACSAPNVSPAETSIAPAESSSGAALPDESTPVTSSLSAKEKAAEDKAAIQKAEQLLAEAEALFQNGEYQEAIDKLYEVSSFYNVTSYTDIINLTLRNILVKSERAMGYTNQDYMRSNVFSSATSGNVPLNKEIRGFFYDYMTKNNYDFIPAFEKGELSLNGILFYAYFFYVNPSNQITEKQVQDLAEKYFGGFPYKHQETDDFYYQDGIYTPSGWGFEYATWHCLTKLTRRTENGKTLYTAKWSSYDFLSFQTEDLDANTKYVKTLMKEPIYADMDEEQIVKQLMIEGKIQNLASGGTMVAEFEAVDTGSEIYFILYSVDKTYS